MPRLDKLSETSRNTLLTMPVELHATSPFVRPGRPLSECRVAIVTSAGLHLRDDRPFVSADPTYRAIPSSASAADVLQSHTSIGFDRTAMLEDINVIFPIDRLREMHAAGRIGELATTFYSFMGAQRDITNIKTQTAPEVAELLVRDRVDVVLLTPT